MNGLPGSGSTWRSSSHMLFRFCLYGFLKNQRYFEPFFMLALLAHGLNYFQIGLLVACRSVTLNLLEIPSGAMADHWGRRRSMIGSFVAYILSFLLFAFASSLGWLILAMVLYGIGDSFRTGTHKAMIFQWLKNEGREFERTQIYGITRSWSQYGSAVSALVAAIFVITTGDFRTVFLCAVVPYVLNIINFLGYPAHVDGETLPHDGSWLSLRRMVRASASTILTAIKARELRRLMAESMAWEGVLAAIEDYLQPALLTFVLVAALNHPSTSTAPVALDAMDRSTSPQVVWAISLTYTFLFVFSGLASRSAHRLVLRAGGHLAASKWLWWTNLALYLMLGISDISDWGLGLVAAFVLLNVLQSVWRPILISRFDDCSVAQSGATILSIESQSQRLATLLVAPVVGCAIDHVGQHPGTGHYWPIAVVGFAAALAILATTKTSSVLEQAKY